jgi:hypothetical protein
MRAIKLPIWLIARIDARKKGNEPRWKVIERLLEADDGK